MRGRLTKDVKMTSKDGRIAMLSIRGEAVLRKMPVYEAMLNSKRTSKFWAQGL